jgi:nucleoside-diphosphate-sugar epimerase
VIANLAFGDLSGLIDRSPDVVVHAAAIPDLGGGRAEPDVLAENVSGTVWLMFAALDAGVRRLIYVSSQSVLGLSRGPGVRPPARLPVGVRRPSNRAASGRRSLVPNQCDLLKISAVRSAMPS